MRRRNLASLGDGGRRFEDLTVAGSTCDSTCNSQNVVQSSRLRLVRMDIKERASGTTLWLETFFSSWQKWTGRRLLYRDMKFILYFTSVGLYPPHKPSKKQYRPRLWTRSSSYFLTLKGGQIAFKEDEYFI